MNQLEKGRWRLCDGFRLLWPVENDRRGQHRDHLEMSGSKVAMVVHFGVDDAGGVILEKELIWPQLPRAYRSHF
jgi:hypothetical protein